MKCCPQPFRLLLLPALLVVSALFAVIATASTTSVEGYVVTVNANADAADRIQVTIELPALLADSNVVVFPVTVPGTYEEHLWWRLVHDFKAYDNAGTLLHVARTADSQFVIPTNTVRISYLLDDSFDDVDNRASVFHPAGTSFQGDSVFVLNHGGIVGYVYGLQKKPFVVRVHHKAGIATQTSLTITQRTETLDEYVADTYDALVDGPALVCKPDTATFMVKDTRVLVAVYSHRPDLQLAKSYVEPLQHTTEAIGRFLPSMPVKNYAFLMYLWNGDTNSVHGARFAQGALEHGSSSFYFWRYGAKPEAIEDIAAHEFLHILVPLNLHSKEIDAFDFRWPQMSEHLWLYEGVTEYFAHQSLLRGGAISDSLFLREMDHCARSLSRLPKNFTLTSFSKNVLSPENQALYPIIYQYGPLNALLADIVIRQETDGAMGMLELVYALMNKYGMSRPFNDDELFSEIGSVTTPKVEEYFRTYVADSNRIPLKQMLPLIGWEFKDSVQRNALTFGVDLHFPRSKDSVIRISPESVNPLGVAKNDILLEVNGKPVSREDFSMYQRFWFTNSTDPITITVERDGNRLVLKSAPVDQIEVVRNVIEEAPNPTSSQLAFRKLVLRGLTGG